MPPVYAALGNTFAPAFVVSNMPTKCAAIVFSFAATVCATLFEAVKDSNDCAFSKAVAAAK